MSSPQPNESRQDSKPYYSLHLKDYFRRLISSIKGVAAELLPFAFNAPPQSAHTHPNPSVREDINELEDFKDLSHQSPIYQPKLSREQYVNQITKKIHPVMAITQYITNEKYNTNKGHNAEGNKGLVQSAFTSINNNKPSLLQLNNPKQIINCNDFSVGKQLKPLTLLNIKHKRNDTIDNEEDIDCDIKKAKGTDIINRIKAMPFGNNSALIEYKFNQGPEDQINSNQNVLNHSLLRKKHSINKDIYAQRKTCQSNHYTATIDSSKAPQMSIVNNPPIEERTLFPRRTPFSFDYTDRKKSLAEYYLNKIKEQQEKRDYLKTKEEEKASFTDLYYGRGQSFALEGKPKSIVYQINQAVALNYDKKITTPQQKEVTPIHNQMLNYIPLIKPNSNNSDVLFNVPKEKQDEYKQAKYESVIMDKVAFGVPKDKTDQFKEDQKKPTKKQQREVLSTHLHYQSPQEQTKETIPEEDRREQVAFNYDFLREDKEKLRTKEDLVSINKIFASPQDKVVSSKAKAESVIGSKVSFGVPKEKTDEFIKSQTLVQYETVILKDVIFGVPKETASLVQITKDAESDSLKDKPKEASSLIGTALEKEPVLFGNVGLSFSQVKEETPNETKGLFFGNSLFKDEMVKEKETVTPVHQNHKSKKKNKKKKKQEEANAESLMNNTNQSTNKELKSLFPSLFDKGDNKPSNLFGLPPSTEAGFSDKTKTGGLFSFELPLKQSSLFSSDNKPNTLTQQSNSNLGTQSLFAGVLNNKIVSDKTTKDNEPFLFSNNKTGGLFDSKPSINNNTTTTHTDKNKGTSGSIFTFDTNRVDIGIPQKSLFADVLSSDNPFLAFNKNKTK